MLTTLPRSINRTGYHGLREYLRNAAESRNSLRTGAHPTNTLRDCPDCEGAGETVVNNTNPHGFGPDPQCDESLTCTACAGSGRWIDGVVDPLVIMGQYRRQIRYGAKASYSYWRRQAMRKTAGMAAMRMRAMAQLCVNESQRALAAWEVAA